MGNDKKYGFHKPVQRLDVHCHLGNDGSLFTAEERMELDRFLGIDHAVILPSPVQDGAEMLPGCMSSREAMETANRYPEHFSWFVNVEPDGSDRVVKVLREAKANGAKGVGEFGTKFPFDDVWVGFLSYFISAPMEPTATELLMKKAFRDWKEH